MDHDIKIFKNFSSEPFTGFWNSVPEEFEAGQSKHMEGWRARHYAKHLIDRELTRKGTLTNTQSERDILMAQCVLSVESEIKPSELIDVQVKEKKTRKGKKAEEEFADLND